MATAGTLITSVISRRSNVTLQLARVLSSNCTNEDLGRGLLHSCIPASPSVFVIAAELSIDSVRGYNAMCSDFGGYSLHVSERGPLSRQDQTFLVPDDLWVWDVVVGPRLVDLF